MRTPRIGQIIAGKASVPMTIHPTSGRWITQQFTGVKPTPAGLLFTTDHGSWLMSAQDFAYFPRHVDNTPVTNWCLTIMHPMTWQIKHGDILPPNSATPLDPRNEADWLDWPADEQTEALEEFWGEVQASSSWQEVIQLIPIKGADQVAIVKTITLPGNKLAEYAMELNQSLTFPRAEYRRQDRVRVPRDTTTESAGPYEHQVTGKIAYFAVKRGGGRYPSTIPPYDRNGEGLMQPPQRKDFPRTREDGFAYATEWAYWLYTGDQSKHPYDVYTKTKAKKYDVTEEN